MKLRKTDQKSIVVNIFQFKNLTANTEIKLKKQAIPGVTCIALKKDSLTLELPSQICGPGHHIEFGLFTTGAGKSNDAEIIATAKVARIDKIPEGSFQVELKLQQFDPATWNSLLSIFTKRQESVSNLFYRMKE